MPLEPLPYQRFAYQTELGSWEFLLAPPPPDLTGVVEVFWISRGRVTFLHEKILPQNNVELMFNLERPFGVPNRPPADRTFRRAWISGLQQDWLLVTPQYDTTQPSYLLSARMPPLGAHQVFGLPMADVAQNVIELDDAFGDQVNRVQEQLGQLNEAGDQFAVLCDFVRRRVARNRVRVHADARSAVAMLARTHGEHRVEAICDSLNISRKHLRQLFQAHVGLSPKAYARVFRFRRVIDLIQSGKRLDWSRIAIASGYYDQAHFNREFRVFAGMSPSEFAVAGSKDGLTILVN